MSDSRSSADIAGERGSASGGGPAQQTDKAQAQDKDRDADQVVTTGDILGWRWTRSGTDSQQVGETMPASQAPAGPQATPGVPPGFDRYQVLSLLGKGGMGEVQLSRDTLMGRDVAVKRILPSLAENSALRTRFIREAQIQGQLEHPAIVPVYDLAMASDEALFFTMKRLRGRTLEDILTGLRENRAADVAEYTSYRLLQVLASVCMAVHFSHCRGVIHRDLKPANIMLGDFGEVYILDWGLAKLRSAEDPQTQVVQTQDVLATADGAVTGTLAYMSPEQAQAKGDAVDARSDIFSLGVILFELLTGERMRPKGTPQQMLLAIWEESPQRPSQRAPQRTIPPELDVICLRATHKDPAARYANARELHTALDRYLAGERDLALRKELAAQHITTAKQAAEQALAGDDAQATARRTALAALGRAMALSPTDPQALGILHRLLTKLPRQIPAEVDEHMKTFIATRDRLGPGALFMTGGALVFTVPMLFAMGVRDFRMMTALIVLGVVSLLLRYQNSRPGKAPAWSYAAQLSTMALYFFIGRILGPLVLMTIPLMVHTVFNSLSGRLAVRRLAAGGGTLLLLGMVAMEKLGVLTPSYSFSDAGMLIMPNLVYLHPQFTEILIIGMTLITILLATFSISRMPEQVLTMERQQALHAWQLSQLLPEENSRCISSIWHVMDPAWTPPVEQPPPK